MQSGILFVLGSALVVDGMQRELLPYATLTYCGVGLGIALSGILTPLLVTHAGAMNAWIGLSLVSIPLGTYCCISLKPTAPKSHDKKGKDTFFPWFVTAYFLKAFGYISSADIYCVLHPKDNRRSRHHAINYHETRCGIRHTHDIALPPQSTSLKNVDRHVRHPVQS